MAKGKNLIEQFENEYRQAYAAAEKAAETTATDGWQGMYGAFRVRNLENRNSAAAELVFMADMIRTSPLSEESRKQVRDAAKMAIEASESAEQFDQTTIRPMREAVENLSKVIAEYEAKAQEAADKFPLAESKTPDDLAECIAQMPKAQWDSRLGMVKLIEARSAA